MTATVPRGPTRWAQVLGYGGLMPFAGLAFAVWLLEPTDRARSLSALVAYGASILGFLGAVHWGLVMRDASGGRSTGSLVWGVTPALVAWIALLIDPATGLWVVVAGLWACFAVDRVTYPDFGVRGWLPMRLVLTVVASLCCAAGAIRVMQ
ncbi:MULTISPECIES: DUF3429 domain-containing protein [unclassified Variovorax]|uniref:DUF3429 domain-containing protein n=1 Tax=unclassified Variovorax TaxID=663243 RepID=UPI002B22454D|nr:MULTISPECIES: DUF3429 domain-containing protein [unclassified Variovorax]MEB0055262.1 DUF3429 domain-containing protein [Variovorax sp. LG9.2]MEB0110159.1 DUF3429 domain-containing protein [Variovorax sp. RTB1]